MTETSSSSSEVPPTVLSALQAAPFPDNIATSSLHPFSASNEKTVAFLQSLLDTTERVAHSVTQHSATVVNDSRTVSLLRQQSAGQHTLHLSRTQVTRTIDAAQERRRTDIGYDGPSDGSSTLARITTWSLGAGMQTSPEPEPATDTLVLWGQVLVLDVALIPEPTVRVSYAGSAEGRNSPAMDAFLSRLVSGVSKGEDGQRLRDALEYLMLLDGLAMHEGNAGARWFAEVDALAKELAKFTQEEAALLAQIRGQPSVPLDVLLLCGHALALPFLHSPALCFLVYLSPRAYLSLQRNAPPTAAQQPPSFDIAPAYLYNCLSVEPAPPGVTRATLTLVPLPQTSPSPADPQSSHPSFPLAPAAQGFMHNFSLPTGPDVGKYGWVLTFGQGIIMSQSRMLEIARVVQPQHQLSYSGSGPSLSFVTGSWVDMLLNSEGALMTERYTATYVSPTNMHPPLRLTLTTPEEPGYLLERVQVFNMQEVWAVLEIVRDQSWLNETLKGISWMPEAIVGPPVSEIHDTEATEEELRALLSGTYRPRSIPVNVYVLAPTAGIGFTFPERPPMPGMVIISVGLSGAGGATVEVQGAMGADVQMTTLAEVVRRGGALGLPGRVWAASQAAP